MANTPSDQNEPQTGSDAAATRPRRKALRALAAALALVAVGAVALLAYQQWQFSQAEQEMAENPEPATAVEAATDEASELPDNPVDFASLIATNSETVGWLYMPACGVNLAIMQSATDDSYYLTHGADGEYNVVGAPYIELANSMDFSDPVTVVYGHDNEGVFKNLHYYEDEAFFNDNPEFYIYTPGHILTYTVVSAYKYDDRHILNSFNFSDASVREEYFGFVTNPESLLKNVREGVALTADSKIVQFSTCMLDEYHGSSRYLVNGVLTSDQATK